MKNKHFFPEFEEATALNKIFAYKQKSKRKQFKNKKGKKSKFPKMLRSAKANISEDVEVENDDFYEKGSLKERRVHSTNGTSIDDDEHEMERDYFGGNGNDSEEEHSRSPEENHDRSDASYDNSDVEPSMCSIPEHDDHIETLIGPHEYEASVSSQLLAPHWTPHSGGSGGAPGGGSSTGYPSTATGHHARDVSHNLSESGYADNDSDSDSEAQIDGKMKIGVLLEVDAPQSDLTPPASDGEMLSPYYDDTPLMVGGQDGAEPEHELHYGTLVLSPTLTPKRSLELRPTNSLNLGATLDELEREQEREREERKKEAQREQQRERPISPETLPNRTRDSDPEMVVEREPELVDDGRQSSLLRPIRENEDSDDETSANDTDAATAMHHMSNLSHHIEDQELNKMAEEGVFDMAERAVFDDDLSDNDLIGYLDESGSDDHIDTMDRLAMQKAASIKMIAVDTNSKVQRHISRDSPGTVCHFAIFVEAKRIKCVESA